MIATFVLICAVLASLAAGVLLAYAACVSLLRLFQLHAPQPKAIARAAPQAIAASK